MFKTKIFRDFGLFCCNELTNHRNVLKNVCFFKRGGKIYMSMDKGEIR